MARAPLSPQLQQTLSQTRVLMVGAGGIGCELLKNLVLAGFENIEIIDLDTIDYSNLNRQFLFTRADVDQSKALTARSAALRLNPRARIVAHHMNVMTRQFDLDYFRGFALVMNALDNLAARRHVNRMCMMANVPLIESGTAGYLGQCQVHLRGESECFDCHPKPAPTTYPICTIRSQPTKYIHCIVWAKHLFALLFGDFDEHNPLQEKDASHAILSGARLFAKLFHDDVAALASVEQLWRDKTLPRSLDLNTVATLDALANTASAGEDDVRTKAAMLADERVWSPSECALKFVALADSLRAEREAKGSALSWDKDIDPHLDFVTTAANLRAICFHLARASRFHVKSEAGNIVPAIASTNAIVGGLIVLEALKLLEGHKSTCRSTHVCRQPHSQGRLFLVAQLDEPNPLCYVCGQRVVQLSLDVERATFQEVIKHVLKRELQFSSPVVEVNQRGLYDEDEDYSDFLPQTLAKLGIVHGTVLDLDDFDRDNAKMQLTVVHVAQSDTQRDEDEAHQRLTFLISGALEGAAGKAEPTATATSSSSTSTSASAPAPAPAVDDDDDVIIVAHKSTEQSRKRMSETLVSDTAKKARTGTVLVLDD